MEIIEGNILEIKNGYIFHCVNCSEVVEEKLAKSLFSKYPKVEKDFLKYKIDKTPKNLLGTYSIGKATPSLSIVSIYNELEFSEENKISTRVLYNSYSSISSALFKFINDYGKIRSGYFPYKMASRNQNSSWTIIKSIIDEIMPSAKIVKLPNQ